MRLDSGGLPMLVGLALLASAQEAVAPSAEQALRTITPPSAAILFTFRTRESSVQTYVCKAANGSFAWSDPPFPDAVLADESQTRLAHHYGGPTWELINGDGKITGDLSQATGVEPDPKAVKWLLIPVRTASGAFGQVKYVQRLDTRGGKLAGEVCGAAHAGAVVRVPYSATYRFLGAKQ